jgi:hypothetical protein
MLRFNQDVWANSCQKNLTVTIQITEVITSPTSNAYIVLGRRHWVNFDKFKGPYLANDKFERKKSHGIAQFMKDGSVAMSEQAFDLPADAEAEIELLASETQMSRELVKIVYSSERAKLERTARIKTYIPVLVHRHVKALLRERRRA